MFAIETCMDNVESHRRHRGVSGAEQRTLLRSFPNEIDVACRCLPFYEDVLDVTRS
jgi:hypothetical protein